MGAKSSKKNIVADTMVEDDSESYNLINIHTPNAGMGISILCVLVGVVCVYRLYRCMVRANGRPSKTGARGRGFPVLPDTAVDMVNHIGHAMPTQGVVVRGGDARNSYWTPKEDPCMTCLEDAWTEHGHRRTRARFGQPDLVGAANPMGVYGGPSPEESPPPRLRARWPGGREESPPPRSRARARARSVESF